MDPSALASGSISSRFQSQTAIDEARETKQKEWREAYAKIGQEPPPQQPEEEYDSRTLYERLATQKAVKTEEWDSKMKLSNQWRGLDSEEQRFLAEKEAERRAAQRKLDDQEAEEVREYRERLAAKHAAALDATPSISPAGPSSASTSTTSSTPASASAHTTKKIPPKAVKKDVKSLMKGVVVKKKPKPASSATASTTAATSNGTTIPKTVTPTSSASRPSAKREASDAVSDGEDEKRRKVGES